MPIYHNQAASFKEIHESPFKLEREIQNLFENNLNEITGLAMVKSEFTIRDKRIDTLAFDEQSKAFVIIEYKRNRNYSVFDQGMTYLGLMLDNNADFIIEYNERFGRKLKRTDVDWSQSRVMFVSTDFTDNQIQATNFKDIAIELWEVKKYDSNLIVINPIKKSKSAASIKPVLENNRELKKISSGIKVYTEEDHTKDKPEAIVELYEKFRDSILGLSDGIEIAPRKFYIGFKKGSNICDIEIQRKNIKIFINAKQGEINDTKNISRDVSNIGHFGNGEYEIAVSDDKDLEYILSLVKQVL
jgi:predicted transport protein